MASLQSLLLQAGLKQYEILDKTPPSRVGNAFPAQANDTLHLEDIEQGVHQIQRLRLYQAEVRILPGQAPEASLIDIQLTESKPWWLQLGVDNQGSKATGTERARVSLSLDNRLGLLDSVGLTYVRSRSSEAAIASLAIPYGYNTWSLSYAASRYTQALPANLEQSGNSSTHDPSLEQSYPPLFSGTRQSGSFADPW